MGLLINSIKLLRNNPNPTYLQDMLEKGTLPNSFYEVGITLTAKSKTLYTTNVHQNHRLVPQN